MHTYKIEKLPYSYTVTVFSPRHGECGVADSRTGFGRTIAEAVEDCEWASLVNGEIV